MQHEITAPQRLLDQAGNIAEPGFAKKQYWQYDRADIKAPRFRIKEWDYYYIGSQDYGLALTVSDAGYVSSLSISLLGFGDEPFQLNDGAMGMFPLGKLHLPYTSEKGDIAAAVGGKQTAEHILYNRIGRRIAGILRIESLRVAEESEIVHISRTVASVGISAGGK